MIFPRLALVRSIVTIAFLLIAPHLTLAQAVAGVSTARDYQLGAGDNIHITVFQSADLTLDTRVSESGAVTYPLVGSIMIGGLTVAAAEAKIAAALDSGGFVKAAQVNINVVQVIGNQVAVLGYVNRPGSYPLITFNTRLTQMLATAGGIALGAVSGSNVVVLTGERDNKYFSRQIDIPSLYLDNHPENDVLLYGGDSIYVPKAPVFYIYGQVQKAGQIPLEHDMTLMQALAAGGGPTLRGSERRIRINRREPDGKTVEVPLGLSDAILPDDVIFVNESFF